jgi:hypothetical protein
MTTSVWNKTEITRRFSGHTTLKEIIEQVESEVARSGEVVCEIRINGHTLDEEDESQIATILCDSLESLVVYSTEPGLLIRQALQSSIAFIPSVQEACVKTSEYFRASNMHQAHVDFNQTLEGCFWLIDTLKHIRGASPGVKSIDTPEWTSAQEKFSGVVKQVVSAYEDKDFVLVADLLEYELSEAVRAWQPVLELQAAI